MEKGAALQCPTCEFDFNGQSNGQFNGRFKHGFSDRLR